MLTTSQTLKTATATALIAASLAVTGGIECGQAYGFSLGKKKSPKISGGKPLSLPDVVKSDTGQPGTSQPETAHPEASKSQQSAATAKEDAVKDAGTPLEKVAAPEQEAVSATEATPAKESTSEKETTVQKETTPKPENILCAEDRSLKDRVEKTPGILVRMQSDRRIQTIVENYHKKRTVHVYLVLSELPVPYTFSLGWMTPVSTAQGELSQDELGEHTPVGQVTKKDFDKGDLAAVQGFDLISNGKLKEAGSQFRKAEKLSPDSPRMHNNMGVFYAVTGNKKKAEEEFATALQLKSNYAVAQINAAWFEFADGKTHNAYDIAHAVLKQVQGFPLCILVAAQSANALTYHNEAVDLAKSYSRDLLLGARFMQLLADADVALGDKNTAKSIYEKLALDEKFAEVNPNNVETLLKLAKAEQESGNLDAATKHARKAAQIDPSDPRAHLYLGLYLEMNRNYRAAQLHLEQVLDLKPTDTVRQAAYGPLLRALLAQDDIETADKYTKKWVKEYPNDPVCHYNRAWLVARDKSDQPRTEAINEYKKALEENPELAQARYNLALLLINSGQSKPALLELKAFLKQSPDDSDAPKVRELVKRLEN